jgi:hypothetical protein
MYNHFSRLLYTHIRASKTEEELEGSQHSIKEQIRTVISRLLDIAEKFTLDQSSLQEEEITTMVEANKTYEWIEPIISSFFNRAFDQLVKVVASMRVTQGDQIFTISVEEGDESTLFVVTVQEPM